MYQLVLGDDVGIPRMKPAGAVLTRLLVGLDTVIGHCCLQSVWETYLYVSSLFYWKEKTKG